MKATLSFLAFLPFFAAPPSEGQQTELHSNFEIGTYCSETEPDTLPVGQDCGTFYQFTGRVSWPPLTSVGPIMISVHTIDTNSTPFPLYVELRNAALPNCTTLTAGKVALVANSVRQCGGVRETIGPIDPATFVGVHLGQEYIVQLVFLRDKDSLWGSVGIASIDVTHDTTTSVADGTWGLVKALYRDTTR